MEDEIQYPLLSDQWMKQRNEALQQTQPVSFGDWLSNIADLARFTIMGRGGVGRPSGSNPDELKSLLEVYRRQQRGIDKQLARENRAMRNELKAGPQKKVQVLPTRTQVEHQPLPNEGVQEYMARMRKIRDAIPNTLPPPPEPVEARLAKWLKIIEEREARQVDDLLRRLHRYGAQ